MALDPTKIFSVFKNLTQKTEPLSLIGPGKIAFQKGQILEAIFLGQDQGRSLIRVGQQLLNARGPIDAQKGDRLLLQVLDIGPPPLLTVVRQTTSVDDSSLESLFIKAKLDLIHGQGPKGLATNKFGPLISKDGKPDELMALAVLKALFSKESPKHDAIPIVHHFETLFSLEKGIREQFGINAFLLPVFFEGDKGVGHIAIYNEKQKEEDKRQNRPQKFNVRVDFDLELSALGPLRINLYLSSKSIGMFIRAKDETITKIEQGLNELRQRLDALGFKIELLKVTSFKKKGEKEGIFDIISDRANRRLHFIL
ncbi:hypothetical protein DBT_0900 [Dissulfuribacter thermophilus]|uniref:Flagellar hook-length control protein-like C-terminal domain-containing protein n=1 Tax=Dissulfuribacter thermophilus TaxID=1156395 RepID=A0A1B9F6I6_9BACT|nr:flagellar hook-length control protein FliK [Dissulfuribacter thermophilus]OCC15549.1 hypothetical protein DBT_0900 [Dissulfuribacter thermophilus]